MKRVVDAPSFLPSQVTTAAGGGGGSSGQEHQERQERTNQSSIMIASYGGEARQEVA